MPRGERQRPDKRLKLRTAERHTRLLRRVGGEPRQQRPGCYGGRLSSESTATLVGYLLNNRLNLLVLFLPVAVVLRVIGAERDDVKEPAAKRLFAVSLLYVFVPFAALIVERLAHLPPLWA